MSAINVTRLAASTILLDMDGVRVLLDPWFSKKPSRGGPPSTVPPEDLPELSLVFASHDAPGHADFKELARHPLRDVPVAAPPALALAVQKAGFPNAAGMAEGEERVFGPVKILAGPSKHPKEHLTAVIQAGGFTVFFGGDTGFAPEIAVLGKTFSRVDAALLPLAGSPGGFLSKKGGLSPEEAAGLLAVLHPRAAAAVGQGAFGENLMKFDGAAHIFSPDTKVHALEPGGSFRLDS